MRLAIITTHPIQYNAPLFKELASRIGFSIHVFYTWGKAVKNKYDPGFGKIIEWDIPLLEGYEYTFVKNIAINPGSHSFKGIDNPDLISQIITWKANAILVFGWNFKSHLKVMRYFKSKIPILFRGDSTLLDEKFGIRQLLRRIYLKHIFKNIDFALYVGTNNKKYFLAHGLAENQLVYTPHSIENHRFENPDDEYQKQASNLRNELGFQKDDLVLMFAGKFESKKNPGFLLDILAKIKNPLLKVVFVGSGILYDQILIASKLDKRIAILDFQNQKIMPVIYRIADLFILPSKGPAETWGLALNEAMASGKAVVSTYKVGGAIDLIENGINGLIIDLKHGKPVYELISKALEDKTCLIDMGKKSISKIQSFTYEYTSKEIEKILNGKYSNDINKGISIG